MTDPHAPQLTSPASATHRGDQLALVVLCLAQAMLVLDVTVVNVALPVMSQELGLTTALAGWAIAAYAVTFGGLLLLGGRLADVFGTRRMLLTGLAVFTIASLAAGLATSAEWFLAARALQGVGAALLSPAALRRHRASPRARGVGRSGRRRRSGRRAPGRAPRRRPWLALDLLHQRARGDPRRRRHPRVRR